MPESLTPPTSGRYSGNASRIVAGQKWCSNPLCTLANPQPLDQFYKERQRPSGYSYRCVTCMHLRRSGALPVHGSVTRKEFPKNHTGFPFYTGEHGWGRVWHSDELAYLEEWYGVVPMLWIQRQLGRSRWSVISAFHRAGFPSRPRSQDGEYMTAHTVAAILGVCDKQIAKWVEAGELRNCTIGEAPVGERNRCKGIYRQWYIHDTDLEAFLRCHGERIDLGRMSQNKHPLWYAIVQGATRRARAQGQATRYNKPWSAREIAFVQNHYGTMDAQAIADALYRNLPGVRYIIRVLRTSNRLIATKKPWLIGNRNFQGGKEVAA